MSTGRNIYEQQAYNKRLTLLVMAFFVFFLAVLGSGFDLYVSDSLAGDGWIPIGTIAAVVIGFSSSVWSLHRGAKAVLQSSGALPLDPSNPQHKQLLNIVEEMKIASGLPMPQVYIIPDDDPNAFATGKDPDHSAIAVTQGLLDSLTRDELQAVIAHEMSHIRNYDVRLMTVVAALVGAVVLLADWARRVMFYGNRGNTRRSRNGKGGNQLAILIFAVWLLAMILAPILSRLMAMAVSRRREYLADASAAELTRNPMALANALRKLEHASAPTASIKHGTAHLCFVDPLGRRLNIKEGFVAELFGTHPPIEKRIMALQAMAYQHQHVTTSA